MKVRPCARSNIYALLAGHDHYHNSRGEKERDGLRDRRETMVQNVPYDISFSPFCLCLCSQVKSDFHLPPFVLCYSFFALAAARQAKPAIDRSFVRSIDRTSSIDAGMATVFSTRIGFFVPRLFSFFLSSLSGQNKTRNNQDHIDHNTIAAAVDKE